MNEQALFCDGSKWYVSPSEPECGQEVTFRFRTAKEEVKVYLVVENENYELSKECPQGEFDYYHIKKVIKEDPFRYHFEIKDQKETRYFGRNGVQSDLKEVYKFCIIPGFSTPEWAKGAVMYQIYTDRFYNGDPTNDVETREYYYINDYSDQVTEWSKYPATMGVREFYGGDLQGVMDKLDYLEDLGVEVIYFNPLFVSPSNHKYDAQDYDYIDPHFGVIVEDGGEVLAPDDTQNAHATKYQKRVTDKQNLEASNELFIKLVEELHKRGMKVILDGVFNHCGSFNKWMDRERIYENQKGYEKGAFVSADSPYRNYFLFKEHKATDWPYNPHYDGWWGHNTLPKLNYEASKELEECIMHVAKKWVSPPYNIDGWRLDVAADLGHSQEYNHKFWKKFRKVVKEANPNAIILAEHYGDVSPWMQGDEWDTVMNYDAFMEPVTWFLTGMEKHSDEKREHLVGNAEYFMQTMQGNMAKMLVPSLEVAMNELSNHDHSRFLTRTNGVVGRVANLGPEAANKNVCPAVMREAVVMQMTWIGAPTLYYGDEAGVCGFTDPDNRRTYPWGKEDKELLEFHREAIRIHRDSEALRAGSLLMLVAKQDILAYGRFTDEEQVVVVINRSESLKEVTIPVWRIGVAMKDRMERMIYSYEKGYTTAHEEYLVRHGEVVLNMGAKSALVMRKISK